MNSFILYVETSTKICSVALSRGMECIALAENTDGDHTRVLNALIRKVLDQSKLTLNELDAIAVNEGPGSFTALRIGVVTAKGIAYALDKPLILIPGLKAIAYALKKLNPGYDFYLSLIDARRDEVYLSLHNNALVELYPPHAVLLNNNLKSELGISDEACIMAGSGVEKWKLFIENWQPEPGFQDISASHLIPLGLDQFNRAEFTQTDLAKPFYLKLPNVTTPKEKLITR